MIILYANHADFTGHSAVSDCLCWYLKQSLQPIDGRHRYKLEYDNGHEKDYSRVYFSAGSIDEMLWKIAAITGADRVCLMAHDRDGNHQHIRTVGRACDLFTGVAA